MSIKQVLVMKSHPTDGCSDAPEIAVYPDAGELLHRVHELRALMRDHGLTEVRVASTPAWGPCDIEEDLRLSCGELVVLNNGFYFTNAPVKTAYDIQTELTPIYQLEKWVGSGAEVIFSDDGLVEAYQQFVGERDKKTDEGDQ